MYRKLQKIAFIVSGLEIGGMQTSLISFANELVKYNYSVHLYIIEGKGELEGRLNESIQITYLDSYVSEYVKLMSTHKKQLIKRPKKFIRKVTLRIIQILGFAYLINYSIIKNIKIPTEYDIAVSYTGYPGIWDEITLFNLKARKKIIWIHNDPIRLGLCRKIHEQYYNRFDAIINVSKDCNEKFNIICPALASKNKLMYNIIDEFNIKDKADGISPYGTDKFIITTVARIQNSSKRFDRIVSCCKMLVKSNHTNFEWHIIGDGPDMIWLRDQIKINSLTECLFAEGAKKNPYPYIKHSNLFALASDYEGLPVVLVEARLLGVPIVVTNIECAKEIIQDGFNGLIVNKEVESLFNGISSLMCDEKKYNRIKNNSKGHYEDNDKKIEVFNSIIDGIEL
jgi:glycosyltransferase involved in cell wall biosynthesis